MTSTTTDKKETLKKFGTSADSDGSTFVEIRAINAKNITPLSMVKSENELALSPNTMFKVVASYTSEHLKDLRGLHLFFHCNLFSCKNFFLTTFFAGLLNIPDKVDMIVLQEIDRSDPAQAPSDITSPYRRRHKPTIDAANTAITTPQDVQMTQPPPQDLGQAISQQHVAVDFSETDSAASDSESVDLQHQHAPGPLDDEQDTDC